ncbi:hypothetical protein Bca52824_076524 [Brassica carinata]|uniref:Uncharacterized protein n=1 Tax=Brassica carinata TaxID=52824 RepID=A0A8X7PU12_BRACI|nr:hypothetical protein Bca52824_076524 [Brassica carinata]
MVRLLFRLLGESNTPSSVAATSTVTLNSDLVIILAALLCALICVLGLIAVSRCVWLRRLAAGNRSSSGGSGLSYVYGSNPYLTAFRLVCALNKQIRDHLEKRLHYRIPSSGTLDEGMLSDGEETQNTHNDDDEEVDVTTTQSSTARDSESSISRFRRSSTVETCGKVYKLAPVTLTEREQSVHQEKKMDPCQSSVCDYSQRYRSRSCSEQCEAMQKQLEALQNVINKLQETMSVGLCFLQEEKLNNLGIDSQNARDFQRPYKFSGESYWQQFIL